MKLHNVTGGGGVMGRTYFIIYDVYPWGMWFQYTERLLYLKQLEHGFYLDSLLSNTTNFCLVFIS